jgi:hypothetical protein
VSIPPTPAERFATLLLWLSLAVDARRLAGRLATPLLVLILDRLRGINQTFARLAARIGAGRFAPRRSVARHSPIERKPRRPNPLPQDFAWLIKLVPEAAASAGQLQFLLADAEMAALLAAAPAPLRRPLRSLCRMLGIDPPTVLAPPAARPRPPSAARKVRPAPERPKQPSRPRYVCGLRYPPPFPHPA